MLLGAHESVAGGVERAIERAAVRSAETLQVFTKNASQWREPPLERRTVETFRSALASWGRGPALGHASYLINLCSDRDDLWQRSLAALAAELERCEALGIAALALHPGAAGGASRDDAIARAAEALGSVLARARHYTARIAIENTAGQGSCIGSSLDEVARILRATEGGERLKVCIDTQHLFAAGYDLRTPEAYDAFWKEFEQCIGVDRIACFHLNDSKRKLGERVDRHEVVGDGEIGLYPFWRLLRDPRFEQIPGVVELPEADAQVSLERLRGLREATSAPAPARAATPLQLTPSEPKLTPSEPKLTPSEPKLTPSEPRPRGRRPKGQAKTTKG